MQPCWLQPILNVVFLEPAHWIMQKRQFANLERLATQDATHEDTEDTTESEGSDLATPVAS